VSPYDGEGEDTLAVVSRGERRRSKATDVIRFGGVSRLRVATAILALLLFEVPRAEQPVRKLQIENPFAGRADVVEEGRSLFNQYCAHCHGPNAVQGERPRDLRRLQIRYGDNASTVFYETVSVGRMDVGMPVWKGILTDEVLWGIFTYLQTVQTQP
jgi:mono/diheme cytochrome c family protein